MTGLHLAGTLITDAPDPADAPHRNALAGIRLDCGIDRAPIASWMAPFTSYLLRYTIHGWQISGADWLLEGTRSFLTDVDGGPLLALPTRAGAVPLDIHSAYQFQRTGSGWEAWASR